MATLHEVKEDFRDTVYTMLKEQQEYLNKQNDEQCVFEYIADTGILNEYVDNEVSLMSLHDLRLIFASDDESELEVPEWHELTTTKTRLIPELIRVALYEYLEIDAQNFILGKMNGSGGILPRYNAQNVEA